MIRSTIFAVFISITLSSFGDAKKPVNYEDLKLTVKEAVPNIVEKGFHFGDPENGEYKINVN